MASTSFQDPDVIKFLDDTYKLLKEEALQKGTDKNNRVVDFQQPRDLETLLDKEITAEPATHDELLQAMKKLIRYSVKTGHPQFCNQLYGGIDPYSQAGAWMSASLNSYIHTYEVGPVFILLEKYIFKKICSLIGFEHGEGLFCAGGTSSNIFALHLARFNKFPDIRKTGSFGLAPMRMYTSDMSHYSLKKGAIYLGFGADNVVSIKTDDRGRMLIDELERCIQEDLEQGYMPLYVNATCGTTVLGSYDDLTALSEVCKTYKLWLHADACWGGGALLSKKHKHLMKGSHLLNSLAWNFHKFSGTPSQCSAFMLNDPTARFLEAANAVQAECSFQKGEYYDNSYDIGNKSAQRGRAVDVLKLWMQWRALGDSGMEAKIDLAFDNAKYLAEKMKVTDGFRLVLPEFECTNICFWYIPTRLRGKQEDESWWQEVNDVAPKLKARMMKAGTMMVQYQSLTPKGFVNFYRVIVLNPLLGHQDMDYIVEEFDRLGHDL